MSLYILLQYKKSHSQTHVCLSGNPANTSQPFWSCLNCWFRGSITFRITGTGCTGAPNRDGAFARRATSYTSSRRKSYKNAVYNSTSRGPQRPARKTWNTQEDTRKKKQISLIYCCCQKQVFLNHDYIHVIFCSAMMH